MTSMQGAEGVAQVREEGAQGAQGGSTEGGRGKGAVQSGGCREVCTRGEGEGQGAWHVHRG